MFYVLVALIDGLESCRFDPLWNSIVVGGLVDGKPFLGTMGMLGTHYSDEHVATGDGRHTSVYWHLKQLQKLCF